MAEGRRSRSRRSPATPSVPARSHHHDFFRETAQTVISRASGVAIFILLLLIVVVAPLAGGATTILAQAPLMLAISLAIVLWAIRLSVSNDPRAVFSLLGAPVLALGTYAVVRYTLAGDSESTARPDMMLLVAAALLFFAVLNGLRHRWQITTFSWSWTLLGSLLTLSGLWQVLRSAAAGTTRWQDALTGRAHGTFPQPADLAVYLHVAFFIALANFWFSRHALRQRIIFVLCAVWIAGGLLVTGAHTHWAGLMAGMTVIALYLLRKRGWRFRWLIMGICLLSMALSLALAGVYSLRRQSSTTPGEEGTQTLDLNRLEALRPEGAALPPAKGHLPLNVPPLWQSAVAIGGRSPLLGAGPGMFKWMFATKRTVQGQPEYVGNTYVAIFSEYGVIGLVLALWIAASFVIAAIQILRLRATRYSAATASNRYAFTIGSLAAVTAVLVDAIFDFNPHVAGNLFTLVAVAATALTCGLHHHGQDDTTTYHAGKYSTLRLRGPTRVVVVLAPLVFLVLLGSRLWQSYAGEYFLRSGEAERQQINWPAAEKAYLRAWKWDKRSYAIARALGDFYSARATWNLPQRATLVDQAFQWYGRALTLNPYATEVYVRMARLHDAIDRRRAALEAYQRAVTADPNNIAYQIQLGLHYQRWDDLANAEDCFRRIRTLALLERLPLAP